MSSDTDQAAPVWAAASTTPEPVPDETPRPRSSRLKTAVIAAAAVVVIVGGGVAVVSAAHSSGTASTTGRGPGGGMGGPGGNFPGGDRQGAGGGLAGALHGDFVASDGNGGYTTKRLQSGTVTAVSSTSITAKSADGHTTTFVVNASTRVDNGNDQISDVKAGDTVTVVGVLSGDTATAGTVVDSALSQAGNGVPPGDN